MRHLILVVAAALTMMAGCGQKPQEHATVPKTLSSSGAVLARVADWTMDVDEFNALIKQLHQQADKQNVDVNNFDVKKKILDQLVQKEALYRIGLAGNLGKDPNIVKLPPESQKELIVQILRRNISKQISVSEEEIASYHAQHNDAFPGSLSEEHDKIRGILVRVKIEIAILKLIEQAKDQVQVMVNYNLLKGRT